MHIRCSTMDRIQFLQNVRDAALKGRMFPVEIDPEATSELAYVGGGEDLVASFLKEWKAVGGEGVSFDEDRNALEYIGNVLEKQNAARVLLWRDPVLERLNLERALAPQGVRFFWWDDLEKLPDDQRRELVFDADVGITGVDWAIAETGTLVLCSQRGGRGKSVSLLPPVHIAVFDRSRLIPDLFDLYPLLERLGDDLPSNVTLITGPSKTGDIQLKLTTGVHGPGEVHAVVVKTP